MECIFGFDKKQFNQIWHQKKETHLWLDKSVLKDVKAYSVRHFKQKRNMRQSAQTKLSNANSVLHCNASVCAEC